MFHTFQEKKIKSLSGITYNSPIAGFVLPVRKPYQGQCFNS